MELHHKLVQKTNSFIHNIIDRKAHEYSMDIQNDGDDNISVTINSDKRLSLVKKHLILKRNSETIATYRLYRKPFQYKVKIPNNDFNKFPEQKKINFYLKTNTSEEKLVVNPDKSLIRIVHNHFYTKAYSTKSNAVVMETIKFIEKNTIKKLPNFVETINVSKDVFNIKGWAPINSKLINSITLIIRNRKSNHFYEFPVTRTDNYWASKVNYKKNYISEGAWDFYLLINKSNYHRVKCNNKSALNLTDTFINSTKTDSGVNSFYITKYGSLSLLNEKNYIIFSSVSTTIIRDSVLKMDGVMKSDLFKKAQDLNEVQLVLRNRDTGEYTSFPMDILSSIKDSYRFSFSLDYCDIIPPDIKNLKWDAYIAFKINNNLARFRVHHSSDKIVHVSKYQFCDPKPSQIFFYSTVNNNLSLSLSNLTITRNIVSYSFDNEQLLLKGYAYINTIEWKNEYDLNRYIVIRHRQTNQEIRYSLKGHLNNLKTNLYTYDYSGFDIDIDTRVLNELSLSSVTNIFDLIIQFDFDGGKLERKLGCEEFQYYRDGQLDQTTTKSDQFYILNYLTFSPHGNLKVETIKYNEVNYNILNSNINEQEPYNDIWLIGERPDTAQDTGYHFFKYCREHHPNREIYYVISPYSKDQRNIEHLGNVLHLGSAEHIEKTKVATTFIGSHELEYFLPVKGSELSSYTNGKRVFLQHGVLGRKNVEYNKKYYKRPVQLFCVSSSDEKELVVNKLGYNEDEVAVTGLSRFDNLLQNRKAKREIIIIPTWREWLYSKEDFLSSEYFKRYKSLLQNEKLLHLLEKYEINLNFYPHYRMQPFIEYFKALETKHIHVINQGERTVQDLLLESSLMITDYSSVSFDFNYMSKPIIFYHFDYDRFFKNGMLRPPEDTFLGDIGNNEISIIDSIEKYILNNFKEDKSIDSNKRFLFDNIDSNNCERIYNEIQRMK